MKTIYHNNNLYNKHTLIGRLLVKLFIWFLSSYYPQRLRSYSKLFYRWVNNVNNMAKNRGKRETLSYCKLVRLSITRYLSGEPLPKDTPKIKLNKYGLPQIMSDFHPLIKDGDTNDLKIVFTMLNLTRGVVLDPLVDYSSITNTWEGNLPKFWHTFESAVMRSIKLKRTKYTFDSMHNSTKSGPNGQAMLFAIHDLISLPSELRTQIEDLGGQYIKNIFAKLFKTWNGIPAYQHWLDLMELPITCNGQFRRIYSFGDKEGKTRVIGIMDYWSQTVLRPIHKEINKILMGLEEDCTFDQTNWYLKLPTSCTYYSFDLTNATDRLPIKHQKLIISKLFNKRIADLWEAILVNYPFSSKDLKDPILYGSGQPMGAYSSWPIMALQHHCLVHYAALLVGQCPKGKYVLLGDDIVICCSSIAESYKNVMTELDVKISEQKTHVSTDICEFAKRWYYRGSEITAFPLHSLRSNLKRYYLLQNSIADSRKKGYVLNDANGKDCIVELIRLTGKKSQALRIFKLYELFDAIVSPLKESNSDEYNGSIRKVILANWKIPEENISYLSENDVFTEQVDILLEDFFLDLTSSGNKEMVEMKFKQNSWSKAVVAIDQDLWEDLITSIPILTSFNACWDSRTELIRLYYSEYADRPNRLKESLEILESLPTTSTRIISTRSAQRILSAQSRLVKALLNHFINPIEGIDDWEFLGHPLTDDVPIGKV